MASPANRVTQSKESDKIRKSIAEPVLVDLVHLIARRAASEFLLQQTEESDDGKKPQE